MGSIRAMVFGATAIASVALTGHTYAADGTTAPDTYAAALFYAFAVNVVGATGMSLSVVDQERRRFSRDLSTEEIGRALFLSPATVRNYLSSAATKLGARNRIDAIGIAQRAGWI